MQLLKYTLLLAVLTAGNVHAHAVLENKTALSGSYFKATIRISHGCHGAAINKVTVEIPDGLRLAKPQPKAGWQLKINKQKLAEPFSSHGKTITEDVGKLVWEGGPLENGYFDEFSFMVKVAAEPQMLYIPVKQECVDGTSIYWHEVPEAGKNWHDYETPAPELRIIESEQSHHH